MRARARILCWAAMWLGPALLGRDLDLHVVDSESGQPVQGVKIRAWAGGNLMTDAAGNCALPLPMPESERFSYRLTLSKEGYVGKYVIWSRAMGDKYEDIPTNYTAKLNQAASIGGVVVDDAGQPIAGARVLFSAPPDQTPGRERSVIAPNYHAERTGADGKWHNNEVPRDFSKFIFRVDQQDYLPTFFALESPPEADEENVTVLTASDLLAGTAKMALGHGIELAGRVTDAAGKPVPGVTITRNHEWRNPAAQLTTDSDGKFSIINLRSGEMILTFQSDGLEAQTQQITLSNGMPQLAVTMRPGRVFRGRVLDETGKPVANATVQMDRVPLGPLEYDWSTTTGADGAFRWDSAPDGLHPYYFSADGYHSLSDPAMKADGEEKIIRLRKEKPGDQTVFSGAVRDAPTRAPLTNYTIRVTEYRGQKRASRKVAVTDANGTFAVPVDSAVNLCEIVAVAPGYLPSEPRNCAPDDGDQRMEFDLTPGTTRDLIGKFDVRGADGAIDWLNQPQVTFSTVVPPPPIALTDPAAREAALEKFLQTDEGETWQRAHRSYRVDIDSTGAFRIQDVPAGHFELRINVLQGGAMIAALTTQIDVSSNSGTDAPLDLGTVGVPLKKVLRANELAPDFTIKTVNGQPLHLADYRGKFVLLDFWATWCGPCVGEMPHLKETFDAFGSDSHFAMISLSLDNDPNAPRQFALSHKIKWTQGFLGKWSDASPTKDYGVDAIPAIFLIGPDGRILEKDLRGDAIRAAVAKALGNAR